MYDLQFTATDDADWAQALELIDATTNLPLDASDASFEIEVTEQGCVRLRATTDDATITRPDANTIQWIFPQSQMHGLCKGTTYKVGCRMTNASGTALLFTGSLAFVDGGMS